MEISFGPFLTCFFAIMFLTIYLYIILYRARNVFAKNTKWLFLGILLIFIRLSVPVNFPFTYSVYSEKFLPRFTNPLCDNKIGNLSIYDCLLILWISVAVIKVLIFFYRKIRLGNYLKNFTQNSDHTDPLYQMLRKYIPAPIEIAIIPSRTSPAITGTLFPILVFPKNISLSEEEIQLICLHELKHYKNHDLWMKLFIELIVCIHWWNPFVYLLQKEYFLTLEINNDNYLKKHIPDFDSVQYAELILKIAKNTLTDGSSNSLQMVDTINFTGTVTSELESRITFILSTPDAPRRHSLFRSVIHTIILCGVLIITIFVVIEPSSPGPSSDTNGTFTLEDDNVCFLKVHNGYHLYVNGKYVGALDTIPDDFKNVTIYTRKEEIPHE